LADQAACANQQQIRHTLAPCSNNRPWRISSCGRNAVT
jgi:hypothetical protein